MNHRIKRVFLDYASTTPVDSRVYKAMKPYFSSRFGNPSAYYHEGLEAEKAVDLAREKVAKITGVKPHEVIFTGSGTEADNLALYGLLKGIKKSTNQVFDSWKNQKPHIITSSIEHPAIMETARALENEELAEVTYLPVLENGKIDTSQIKKYFKPETLVISIILANNEIGTIQSVRDFSKEIKKYKNELGRRFDEPPYLHTDASQAPNYLDVNIDRLGAHMMTLDASKIYGPKGIGCLIKKSYVPLSAIQQGGSQEFGLRPGTENVPSIVGFATALELAQKNISKSSEKMLEMQKYFFVQIKEKLQSKNPEIKINGSIKDRLPNNINICIPGLNSEFAVIQLDEMGLACSAMTACKSSSEEARSYVVDALGYNCGKSSLRFTLGRDSNNKDIDFAIKCLSDII